MMLYSMLYGPPTPVLALYVYDDITTIHTM